MLLSSGSRSSGNTEYQEGTQFVLGTVCTIRIWGNDDPDILKECFDYLNTVHSLMSPSVPDSDLDRLKKAAGKKAVRVDSMTMEVIEKGLEYAEISRGYFDISIGPLVSLWDINSGEASVPEQSEIDRALSCMGYSDIIINKADSTVFLKREGMAIDLGGIAKGYASDGVREILLKHGISSAMVNLGGNIFAVGRKNKDTKWAIGIQSPFEDRGTSIGRILVEDTAVITSGPYERFFIEDGVRYHHILNPFTGYPVVNNIEGVSVYCRSGIDGDALSTTFFSFGIEKGLELAERLDETEVIYITKDRELYMSSGAAQLYEPIETSYTIKTFK